jgi:hypothetical protein
MQKIIRTGQRAKKGWKSRGVVQIATAGQDFERGLGQTEPRFPKSYRPLASRLFNCFFGLRQLRLNLFIRIQR